MNIGQLIVTLRKVRSALEAASALMNPDADTVYPPLKIVIDNMRVDVLTLQDARAVLETKKNLPNWQGLSKFDREAIGQALGVEIKVAGYGVDNTGSSAYGSAIVLGSPGISPGTQVPVHRRPRASKLPADAPDHRGPPVHGSQVQASKARADGADATGLLFGADVGKAGRRD